MVQRRVPQDQDASDMVHLRRIGLSFYARFIVPKDRWADVGKATHAPAGERREIVRTLGTRDHREALKRRTKALAAIQAHLNGLLASCGLPPLDDGWAPDWQAEALRAREEIRKAPDDRHLDGWGTEQPSKRDAKKWSMFDRAEEIGDRLGSKAAKSYIEIATAELTPIRGTADRWLKDITGSVKKQTAQQHGRSLDLLGEFLAGKDGGDEKLALHATGMEAITRRVAGEFVEWLQQTKGLHPKTVASRVSGLSALWKWAERKGLTEQTPWVGQTAGLKKKADALQTEENDQRPYDVDELVKLLRADPNAGIRWGYGTAIFDLLRLGLITGARQNELASLRRQYVLPGCVGISVRSEVAKTRNSVRKIPVHSSCREILRARLNALAADEGQTAYLFPELPPGGADSKKSWKVPAKFKKFRESVLGANETIDFHSLRRSFSTFFALARVSGATACSQDMQDDLMGHGRQALSGNTYTAKDLGWARYVSAVDEMVQFGMPAEVLKALLETAANRPAAPIPSQRRSMTRRGTSRLNSA